MRAGDLENLTHLLDKNAGFTRPDGQIVGYTLDESNGKETPSNPNAVAVGPNVSLPATIVDKQLNLPAPSLGKKNRAKHDDYPRPRGNEIWSQEELRRMLGQKVFVSCASMPVSLENVVGNSQNRVEPKHSILQQQRITAQDVYLGVDFTRDAGTSDGVLVKIEMPKLLTAGDLTLHVDPFQLYVSSPDYYLNAALPRRCFAGKADAVWDNEKKILEVRLIADTTDEVKMI